MIWKIEGRNITRRSVKGSFDCIEDGYLATLKTVIWLPKENYFDCLRGGRTRRLHAGLGAGTSALGLTGTAHWGASTEQVGAVRPCRPILPAGNFPPSCFLLCIPTVGKYQRFDSVLPRFE
jgi:hypothetical protein